MYGIQNITAESFELVENTEIVPVRWDLEKRLAHDGSAIKLPYMQFEWRGLAINLVFNSLLIGAAGCVCERRARGRTREARKP